MASDKNYIPEPEKRAFLKGAGLSIAALMIGGLSMERYVVPKDRGVPVMDNFPLAALEDPSGTRITTTDVINYAAASPSSTSSPILVFNYPLQDEPNFLIVLKGVKVTTPKTSPSSGYAPVSPSSNAPMDGIIYTNYNGINYSILAVSGICQHLGCVPPFLDYHPGKSIPFESKLIGYQANAPGTPAQWPDYGLIYCKCHGSQYNPLWGGRNLYNNGPASSPANHSLPQIMLATDSSNRIYAYGINSTNAVIRTHLQFPGGETYGSQVKSEDLTGGTAIRTSRTPTVYPSTMQTGDITSISSPNYTPLTTSSLGLNSNSSGIILYRTTVVSNEGTWKGSFSGSTSNNSS
ncbi:ubiquinol-cytochrome c reductase iron-sulfur subunit [Ferroplasma sp.]|uniref:ubiquinol-cytochrome c reductase iron-sulfur subunit n=1 Tax=Ferroplasma sp. TaxID=2591003 RepID=UPI00307F0659